LLNTPSVAEATGRAAREFVRREDSVLASLAERLINALKIIDNSE
jgi:hypothetical protein